MSQVFKVVCCKLCSGDKKNNTLTNDKILDLSKFKGFTDDKANLGELTRFVSGRFKSIVWKGEKCLLPAVSPSPTKFLSDLSNRLFLTWGL